MKIISTVFLLVTAICSAQSLKFENSEFEKIILAKYPEIDSNKNNRIEQNEAESLEKLSLMETNLTNANDVRYFRNLTYLSLTINNIEEFIIKDFFKLEKLYIARNKLNKLEINNLPLLNEFACGLNQLTTVKIKNCPNILSLNMMDNQIKKIDLSQFKELKYLTIDNNKLESLDLSNNLDLIQITIDDNNIKTLDITKNQNLKMNILYIDNDVKIIGTSEQLSGYKSAVKVGPPPPSK